MTAVNRDLLHVQLAEGWNAGQRRIQTLADNVGCSPGFARKALRQMGLLTDAPQAPRDLPNMVLSPEQQAALFASLVAPYALLDVRRAAREMFGLELLDVTVRRYIQRSGLEPLQKAKKPRTLTPEQFEELVSRCRATGSEPSFRLVQHWIKEATGKTVARATAFNYLREVRDILKAERHEDRNTGQEGTQ